ncbi:hypothetical protein ACTZWT_12030 [Rhodopseudomonas sp. NSM]|uniref:hypothetical protein n=1 Tax=Rhodopseudomonas sp. NSM TaxID=3457630 RepID=UPI0040362BDB
MRRDTAAHFCFVRRVRGGAGWFEPPALPPRLPFAGGVRPRGETRTDRMPILLQGTVAFEPEFVGNLALLTRTLIARGLDPDCYVIAKDISKDVDRDLDKDLDKDLALAPALRFVGLVAYDYAVDTGGTRFVVTEVGDARFLEAFLRHIGDPDGAAPALIQGGMFSRLTRWMSPQI